MTPEQWPPQGASAQTIASHGLVNHDAQRYDEALADFSRAIDWLPEWLP